MNIGFIGSGNMGGAIIKAVATQSSHTLYVYDKDTAKLNSLASEYSVNAAGNIAEIVEKAQVIFICVKPVAIAAVLQDIKNSLGYKMRTYVSIAAGVKVNVFTDALGEIQLVRTMPNLPAMVKEGFTVAYFHNMAEKYEMKAALMELFNMFGKAICVDSEKYVDKCISVTSSSPAYICMMIEAMADGAVKAGFARKDAIEMVLQSVYGTAKYLMETGMHPAALKDAVCSPAGTTIEAVASLEESGFRASLINAMERCEKKAEGKI